VRGLLCVISLGLVGCDDPLLEAQHIEHTRVLGARVEVASDASRASPQPGEAIHMQWLVADPRPSPNLGWHLSACAAAQKTRGTPECADAPFAQASSALLDPALPVIDFVLPDAATLGSAKKILVYGDICSDEQPEPNCSGDGAAVVFEIPIEVEPPGNKNPTLGDETILLDGVDWPAAEPAWLGVDECATSDSSPSLPVFESSGGTHSIALTLSDDDRDPNEELWVSQFSTRGDLDRVLSVIPKGEALSVKSEWQEPDSISIGRVVRFWFVVRDLRGGVDWSIRTLCAVP
jgi:hypothetical protein